MNESNGKKEESSDKLLDKLEQFYQQYDDTSKLCMHVFLDWTGTLTLSNKNGVVTLFEFDSDKDLIFRANEVYNYLLAEKANEERSVAEAKKDAQTD